MRQVMWALWVVVLLTDPAFAASLVQSKSAAANSASTVNVTPTSNLTAGNLAAVFVGWNNTTSTFTSVTDTCGNTYTVSKNVPYSSTVTGVSLTAPITTGGACVLTATISASTGRISITLHELSSAELDKSDMAGVASTTTPASPSVTTTADGEYIMGWNVNNAGRSYTAGSGYTTQETDAFSYASEDRIQTSQGSISADWTLSGTAATVSGIMTFKTPVSGACTLMLMGVGSC